MRQIQVGLRSWLSVLAVVVICLLLAGGVGAPAAEEKKAGEAPSTSAKKDPKPVKQQSLAVLDFGGESGVEQSEARLLTDMFISSLQKTKKYKIMTRGDISKVMKEQQFQITELVAETDKSVAFGKLLKVQQIITGRMGKVGSTYVVIIHVIDVETGQEVKTIDRTYQGRVDYLILIMHELAYEIAGMKPPPPPKTPPPPIPDNGHNLTPLPVIDGYKEFAKEETLTGSGPFYLKHNLWYEKPTAITCINYQRGTMLPAGTQVKNVILKPGGRGRNSVVFTSEKDGMEFTISFSASFHPGVTPTKFMGRMFTKKPFTEWTKDLTQQELDCVKKGVHQPGIGKKAVLMTYGFPPEHKTPTLETPRWYYWQSRFGNRILEFGANGLAVK